MQPQQGPVTWLSRRPSTSAPPSATVLRAMVADRAMASADWPGCTSSAISTGAPSDAANCAFSSSRSPGTPGRNAPGPRVSARGSGFDVAYAWLACPHVTWQHQVHLRRRQGAPFSTDLVQTMREILAVSSGM